MKRKLFALFNSEEQAQSALRDLEADAVIAGHFSANVRREPWTGVGEAGHLFKQERSVVSVSRFSALVGAGVGLVLAVLFRWPLGLLSGPAWLPIVGATVGAILGGLAGLWLGTAFPDQVLQKFSAKAQAGRVLLDVGVDNEDLLCSIRQTLRKHKPQRMAYSQT